MARSVIALALAALLAVVDIGSCLKCYHCNSQTDPKCKDPFTTKEKLIDCGTQDSINYNELYLRYILPRELIESVAGAPRYCHKLVMQNGSTIRTCLDANPTDLATSCRLIKSSNQGSAEPSKMIKSCDVCDKDSCNSAGTIGLSVPLVLLAAATYLYNKQ